MKCGRDKERLRRAKAAAVDRLFEKGLDSVCDPKEFVDNYAAAVVYQPENSDEAGEAGEAVIEAVLRRLMQLGMIRSYLKTEKGGLEDRRGVDFFVEVSPEFYPYLGRVEIDAAYNNDVLVKKMAKLRRWMKDRQIGEDAETYLLRNGRVILSADNADSPERTLVKWLEDLNEFRGRRCQGYHYRF